MTNADEFKECFDTYGFREAKWIMEDYMTEFIHGTMEIIVDFIDGSTFRYHI
jgi:hypothetical protein